MKLKTASSVSCLTWKGIAVVFLLLTITFASTKSDGSSSDKTEQEFGEKKLVVGSKPPTCLNKCFSCRPCKATLVITPRQARKFKISQVDGGNYYPLIWKCRCGNKLFRP